MMADLKFAPPSHCPDVVVDISRADDLKHIAVTEKGLSIGALVTHTQIMRSPLIRDIFPALQDAAHTIGAVQTRNLGTLGGNLVTGVPSMDSGPHAGSPGSHRFDRRARRTTRSPPGRFLDGPAQDRPQTR